MDSDRVMVLSAGELVVWLLKWDIQWSIEIVQFQEMDTPHNLMQNEDSHFSKLAKNAGKNVYHELKEMAAINKSRRK